MIRRESGCMAELAVLRCGPLEPYTDDTHGDVALSVAPSRTKLVVRCGPDATATAGQAFGVTLPGLGRSASANSRAALWLGPDEWLLLAPPDEAEAIASKFASELAAPHALVDVCHRSAGIVVEGPRAATLLNCGCPLDLRSDAFQVGMCTRTLFEKSAIILWRVNTTVYHLEIERSFAPYVWTMLIEMRGSLA
jgi:sarcosine oxidase subunit gamma